MRPLKLFSRALALFSLGGAAANAVTGFNPPVFSAFLVIGMMALSYYYFERWYERWLREAERPKPH